MQPVAVWIDAREAVEAVDVFGMSLVERLVRAVLEAGITPSGVEVCAAASEHDSGLAARFGSSFPLSWRTPGETTLGDAPRWLVLDRASLVDPRLLAHLASCEENTVAWGDDAEAAGAAMIVGSFPAALQTTAPLRQILRELEAAGALSTLDRNTLASYLPRLRRDLTPYCLRVTDRAARDRAERALFWGNYKGSTDFFTKHVYPPLVWALVRPLARWRVHPNWISVFNVFITIAAVPLFAAGSWVIGLGFAYTMSVLDSVDGKLARLTFRSSKVGHVLDHGLDVVHPPFWYAGWAWALDGGQAGVWFQASLWLAGAYFLDRIVTEAFTRTTQRSIHAYAPVDVRMRTWISRRNINVPLFTLGLVLGFPEVAFALVIAWQGLTLLFHALRLVQVNLALSRGAAPPPTSSAP